MNNVSAQNAAAGMAPSNAQETPAPPEQCLHVRTRFSVIVNAPYQLVAPLFGPLGEEVWVGPQWDPTFIYPQPARDIEGAVFTVYREPDTELWMNTIFDLDHRHIQYIYSLAGLLLTIVDLRFEPVTARSTRVNVAFTRTALTPQANERTEAMAEKDRQAPLLWKQKIDAYLAASHRAIQN